MYDSIMIDHCKVAGLLNEGTYVANTLRTSVASGPMRAFVGTYRQISNALHGRVPEIERDISKMFDSLDQSFIFEYIVHIFSMTVEHNFC